jgi:hypothetical protein
VLEASGSIGCFGAFSLKCFELVEVGTGESGLDEGCGLDDGSLKVWLWDPKVGCGVWKSNAAMLGVERPR